MIGYATSSLIFLVASLMTFESVGMTAYDSYDPLQLYSSADPHEFLYTLKKDKLLGIVPDLKHERVSLSTTFFTQKASSAKNTNEQTVLLGDMLGMWNMLALTYDHCPTTTTLTPNLQEAARTAFGSTIGTVTATDDNPFGQLFFGQEVALTFTNVSEVIGPDFGMVSAPLEYKKSGARFEASILIFNDIGARIQGGFSEIQQSLTSTGTQIGFIDQSATNLLQGILTPQDLNAVQENLSKVNRVLDDSDKVIAIANELGLDVSDFRKSGFEDIRGSLFWRHAIPFNMDREGWPKFLLMPFAQVYGTLAIGARRDPFKQFSVSFGNNGHDSVGFNAGVALDFADTLELAVEAGGTFFSTEQEVVRLPTHLNQRGILPCTSEASVTPGHNWHFIATFNAKRFIDKLSGFAQFIVISHNKDKIRIPQEVCADPNFCPKLLPFVIEEISQWDWRMFTLALNYEIAPGVSLGGLYQGPLSRKNAPRTKTILGSLVVMF